MVLPIGLEPITYSLEGCRNLQLCYESRLEGDGLFIPLWYSPRASSLVAPSHKPSQLHSTPETRRGADFDHFFF